MNNISESMNKVSSNQDINRPTEHTNSPKCALTSNLEGVGNSTDRSSILKKFKEFYDTKCDRFCEAYKKLSDEEIKEIMLDYEKELVKNPIKALADKLTWCEQLIENHQ